MLLFIHGPDTYRAREKVRAIKQRYEARHPGAFELHEFDLSDVPDGNVLKQTLETAAFFAAHKLVVVKDFFRAPTEVIERTIRFLKDANVKKQKDATLLFWERQDLKKEGTLKAESAKAAFAWLKRNALTEEYAPLVGAVFSRWAKGALAQNKMAFAVRTLAEFCRAFDGDTWRAALEIEKISLGHPLVLPQTQEAGIFDLVRALWRRDQKRALGTLNALLAQGVNEFRILAMMAYAVRKSLERVSPGAGYQTGTLREREAERLRRLHQQIATTDLKIKTGELEARFGLELLTLRLTNH